MSTCEVCKGNALNVLILEGMDFGGVDFGGNKFWRGKVWWVKGVVDRKFGGYKVWWVKGLVGKSLYNPSNPTAERTFRSKHLVGKRFGG